MNDEEFYEQLRREGVLGNDFGRRRPKFARPGLGDKIKGCGCLLLLIAGTTAVLFLWSPWKGAEEEKPENAKMEKAKPVDWVSATEAQRGAVESGIRTLLEEQAEDARALGVPSSKLHEVRGVRNGLEVVVLLGYEPVSSEELVDYALGWQRVALELAREERMGCRVRLVQMDAKGNYGELWGLLDPEGRWQPTAAARALGRP